MSEFSENIKLAPWFIERSIVITCSKNKKYTLIIDPDNSPFNTLFYDIYKGRTVDENSKPIAVLHIWFEQSQGFNFAKYDDEILDEDAISIVNNIRKRFNLEKKVITGNVYRKEIDEKKPNYKDTIGKRKFINFKAGETKELD